MLGLFASEAFLCIVDVVLLVLMMKQRRPPNNFKEVDTTKIPAASGLRPRDIHATPSSAIRNIYEVVTAVLPGCQFRRCFCPILDLARPIFEERRYLQALAQPVDRIPQASRLHFMPREHVCECRPTVRIFAVHANARNDRGRIHDWQIGEDSFCPFRALVLGLRSRALAQDLKGGPQWALRCPHGSDFVGELGLCIKYLAPRFEVFQPRGVL